MKKIFFITTFIFVFGFVLFPDFSFAQGLMGFPSSSSDSATVQSQQQEEREGKQFLDNLNNKIVTCSQLKDADLEKIGEYFMGQSIGDTSRHIAMNNMMKSMMGEQGEEQMHIAWGKRGSSCDNNVQFAPNITRGGGIPMMGYGTMNWMVGSMWGFGFLGLLIEILVVVVLVLLVIYFWKQIQKK